MTAASIPAQRPLRSKLLVADGHGAIQHWARADFVDLFQAGDLVIANDAVTVPASLAGRHVASGRRIEVRLAGRDSLAHGQVGRFAAVLFGLGDFRTKTEDRPPPPAVHAGDQLALGPLRATVAGFALPPHHARSAWLAARGESPASTETGEAPRPGPPPRGFGAVGWRWRGAPTENIGRYLKEEQRCQSGAPAARPVRGGVERGCIAGRMPRDFHHGLLWPHPRFVELLFDGAPGEIWQGLTRHGRPVQYSHVPAPLALWDTWTPIAGSLAAFEAPSAGFALNWRAVATMTARGIRFATVTHAAGLSSTGDAALDEWLPLDEPYRIPAPTAAAIRKARAQGHRIIAIGTTVVRALEHAAERDGHVHAGAGLATQRITATSHLHVVDAILSGTHELGTSHYDLLRAFADDETLARIDGELSAHGYLTHEFGDSVFLARRNAGWRL